MIHPRPLLLVPLALALGLGSGWLVKSPKRDSSAAKPASVSTRSSQDPLFEQRVSLWRARFLLLLEEPSSALQTASYYAFARELSVEDMPYVLEGMYPEGWTRFRGDLPLAILMEWAKRDSQGLAIYTAQFFNRYPDLEDNFEGVYYNLGLQNAPGAVDTVAAFPESLATTSFASEFLAGLREHPERLFEARLKIRGAKEAFASTTDAELEAAVTAFWANPVGYLDEQIIPDPSIAIELGKRYPEQSIQIFDTSQQIGYVLAGAIAANHPLSSELLERINTTWFDWNTIGATLTKDEAHALLSYLSRQEAYWIQNPSYLSYNLLASALDQELARALIDSPHLPEQTRTLVFANSAPLFSQNEYLGMLSETEESTRIVGLQSLLRQKTPTEAFQLLQQLPTVWLSKPVLDDAFNKAATSQDRETFALLCETFSANYAYLPNDTSTSSLLWENDPELYLKNIETLNPEEKKYHLNMVASIAAEEEIGIILESGTFEQQTDVLINLIHNNPFLSAEILKSEDPDLFSSQQASSIGNALAQTEDRQVALAYFHATDIQHEKNQVAILNFYSMAKMLEQTDGLSTEVAALSPKHDYLYRTANAFFQESDNPAELESLRREDPRTFLTALTTLINKTPLDTLRTKASKLLSSAALSPQEKLEIHSSLYGEPRS